MYYFFKNNLLYQNIYSYKDAMSQYRKYTAEMQCKFCIIALNIDKWLFGFYPILLNSLQVAFIHFNLYSSWTNTTTSPVLLKDLVSFYRFILHTN